MKLTDYQKGCEAIKLAKRIFREQQPPEIKEKIPKTYFPSALAGLSFPVKKQKSRFYERTNGLNTIALASGDWKNPKTNKLESLPLPYGIIPRQSLSYLALAYKNNLKNKVKNPRVINLGTNLFDFIKAINTSKGGKTYKNIKNQLEALFRCRILIFRQGENYKLTSQNHFADKIALWWDPKKPQDNNLFDSTIEISEALEKILTRIMPINLDHLKSIGGSCLAFDLYIWLAIRHKEGYTEKPIKIRDLHEQLGANYKEIRDFKKELKKAWNKILEFYPHNSKIQGDYVYLKYNKLPVKPTTKNIIREKKQKEWLGNKLKLLIGKTQKGKLTKPDWNLYDKIRKYKPDLPPKENLKEYQKLL